MGALHVQHICVWTSSVAHPRLVRSADLSPELACVYNLLPKRNQPLVQASQLRCALR